MHKDQVHKDKTQSANSSIFGLLKPYKGLVAVLIFFALAGNSVNLVIPLIISRGIDRYNQGNHDLQRIIIEFAGAALLIFLFNYLQGIVQTYTSEKAARSMREKLADKISRQSYAYIMNANPSKLLTNLTSDVDAIKIFIAQAFSSIVSSVFVISGASILLLTINWKLALAVLVIIPLIGGAFFIMLRKVRPLFRKSREVIDWLNRVINESILGAMLIRILNSQQFEYRKFLEANTSSRDIGMSILNLFAALIPFITFVSNMAILTILVLGGHFVITGEMTIGNLAAFNNYIGILIFPILVIGFMSNMIAHANASFQRVKLVLDVPDVVHTGYFESQLSGMIEIKDVHLVFDDKPVLKNINIHIDEGSKVAIIGPTAAGKTQLLYLLAGLTTPTDGQILYDDRPIEVYKPDDFYRQIGFVFQDSIIFNLTLRENISFGNAITEEQMQKAIETAELSNYVHTLPEGLDTVISERGSSLSGGQKQRIMLARALAQEPAVLLLDDFTARIDRRTEQKIMKNIHTNYRNITILTITQKIAPVEHFEQIILLMEGEIIASGRHDELLGTCPEYIQIYNSQRSTSHYDVQS